jgi:hypothetical protein
VPPPNDMRIWQTTMRAMDGCVVSKLIMRP